MDSGVGGSFQSAYSTISYDASGQLIGYTMPNGVVDSDTYNTVGQLVARTYTDSASNQIATWTRTFRINGQVATETAPSANGANRTLSYAYDAAGRLTQATDLMGSNCTTRTYTFNANSDRTGQSAYIGPGDGTCPTTTANRTRSASFNAYDQAGSITVTGNGAGTGNYAYDALGRATTIPQVDTPTGAANLTLTYMANDLISTETQGSNARAWTLDPTGRLASWTDTGTGAGTGTNYYDNSSDSPAWSQTTPSGGSATWSRMLAGPSGQLSVVSTGPGGSSTPTTADVQLVDLHGDVYATIPDTANVNAASLGAGTDYDEYGNPIDGPGATYGWIGSHERSTNLNLQLIQMGVRVYNPASGQFTSVDPVYGGNPNPYTYPTDPISGFDLNGQCWISWVCRHASAMMRAATYGSIALCVVLSAGWCAAAVAAGVAMRSFTRIATSGNTFGEGFRRSLGANISDAVVSGLAFGIGRAFGAATPRVLGWSGRRFLSRPTFAITRWHVGVWALKAAVYSGPSAAVSHAYDRDRNDW